MIFFSQEIAGNQQDKPKVRYQTKFWRHVYNRVDDLTRDIEQCWQLSKATKNEMELNMPELQVHYFA